MKTKSIWDTKIKKYYSDHPRLTEQITLREALKRYYAYIQSCIAVGYYGTESYVKDPSKIKTFQQWRTTEI